MVVLIVYGDLDNDAHDHWIVPSVEDIHLSMDEIDGTLADTLVNHDENSSAVVMVAVNMVNET